MKNAGLTQSTKVLLKDCQKQPIKNNEKTDCFHTFLLFPFLAHETHRLTEPEILNTPKIVFLKSLRLIEKYHASLVFNCVSQLSTRMPTLIMSSLNIAHLELSISTRHQ